MSIIQMVYNLTTILVNQPERLTLDQIGSLAWAIRGFYPLLNINELEQLSFALKRLYIKRV